jgi:molybdate transport system substrate-binding protein
VVDGPHLPVTRVGIGLFGRADAETPDISRLATFKDALLNADTLVFSNVAAGNYFATVLDRLGIADAVRGKVIRANPPDVVGRVVEGKGKDIGVLVVTLIVADKRLKLIGPLPPELQRYLVYTAALMTNSQSPETGKQFIQFLASPAAKKESAAAGAE